LNDTVILRKISSHWQALRRFIDDSGVAYILGHPVIYIWPKDVLCCCSEREGRGPYRFGWRAANHVNHR